MHRLIAALVVMCVAVPARAQRVLTLDEALQLARERNRDLAAARTRLEQASVGVTQALGALLPIVATQGKYTHNYREVTLNLSSQFAPLNGLAEVIKLTSNNPVQNGAINAFQQQLAAASSGPPIVIQKSEQLDFVLSATIPLIVPWAYPNLDSAKQSNKAAGSAFEVTEAAVLFGTAQAFFAVAGAERLHEARVHAIDVAQKTVDNAKAKLAAGTVNRVEVMRAEVALLRATQAEKESQDLIAQTYRVLTTLIQLREPYRVNVTGEVSVTRASPDELSREALSLRPEFTMFERNLDAIQSQRSSAQWRWAPTLSAFGLLRAFNYAGFSGDNYAWAIGLQLDWVIYDGGLRDAGARLAALQKKETELRLAQLKETIVDELVVARRALDTKVRALETAKQTAQLAKETLELVRVQHDAGTATQLDLLVAQDNFVGAELGLVQSRFDLELSDLAVQRLAGLFPKR